MQKETMSIHRALMELKVIDTRIGKEINGAVFVKTNRHSNVKISGVSINEYEDIIKSGEQKINDLIKRRNAIKRAVSYSNAITKVVIGGEEYTVAVAIEMKNHGIELKQNLLSNMEYQYNRCITDMAGINESLPESADNYAAKMFAGREKVDNVVIEEAKKTYIVNNTLDLIDPIGIKKKIDELHDEIDGFTAEVDAVLSESNATTMIDIEY